MPPESQPPNQPPPGPQPSGPQPHYPQQPYPPQGYGPQPYGQQPYGQPGVPPPPYAQPGPYGPPKKDNNVVLILLVGCGAAGIFGLIILAAILFPAFSQARLKAQQVSCLSNIKQQSLGILMYSQDYDERMPPAGEWMDLTQVYIRREDVLHCPTVHKDNPAAYGYAFDTRLSRKSFEKVPSPQLTPMVFDSNILTRNATDTGGSFALSPRRHIVTGVPGGNVGFADGHAKTLTSFPSGGP